MIDARTDLYWKWRGNPSDPFIGALPSNWWKTKQNHRKLWKFAILTQNLDYFNVSIYSLKMQRNFVQIVLFSGHKHGENLSFWKLTPPGLQPLDAKWRWSCHVSYEISQCSNTRWRLKFYTLCRRYLTYRMPVQFQCLVNQWIHN